MKTLGLFERAYTGICRDAWLSPCLTYRYSLKRWWTDDPDASWACWIMLNPSTADAAKDDHTIRKCMAFTRSWGMGGMGVVNLFAWRATDPKELLTVEAPVGPENNKAILAGVAEVGRGVIVAAWGADKMAAERGRTVETLITDRLGMELMCLGTTKSGHPKHPLYLPGATKLVRYAGTRMESHSKETNHALLKI